MLTTSTAVLVVIDIQEKLAGVMHDPDTLITQAGMLIDGCQALEIPVLWTEQYPAGLGVTVEPVAARLAGLSPIEKRSFSALAASSFEQALGELNRPQAIICGIESHVCVWQTALDLIGRDIEVQVAADAVSARTAANHQAGVHRIEQAGGILTTVEMALFELLGSADHERFRDVARLVK